MLIKTNGVIFELTVQGWDGKQWGANMADELLTDAWLLDHQVDEFRQGYTLTQPEFAEFVALVTSDAESYNAGGNAGEWLIRGDHAPAEIAVSVTKVCDDEDSADAKTTIWQLQRMSAKAPAHKKDWHNGMVTDADDALKSLSPIAWFLSREAALAELSKYDSYVDDYGTAHEYQVEEYLVGDLADDSTWDLTGDLYVREYPYVQVYAESPYYGLRFVQLFKSLDEAEREVASSWGGEPWTANLEDSETVLHYKNLDGATIKTQAVQREEV